MIFAGRRPLFARGTQIGDQQAAQPVVAQRVAMVQPQMAVKPSTGMLQHSAGTKEDPHVFVGLIRDHRGLSDDDQAAFDRNLRRINRLIQESGGEGRYYVARAKLRRGDLPFEVFTNVADGERWGKFYNVDRGVLVIKPAPAEEDRAWYESIGYAIVWFGEEAWDALKYGCDKLQWATSGQKDDVAYALISVAASPGAAAAVKSKVEIAKKICRGVAFVDSVFGGREPAQPLTEDWDRPETRVSSTRRGDREPTLPVVMRPAVVVPRYPPEAFAVYDPVASRFRILVPQELA